MAEAQETKSERVTLALTPGELQAVDFISRIHPGRFEGVSSVLREYSVSQCVEVYRLALANVPVGSTA